jgi:hypothetical protein
MGKLRDRVIVAIVMNRELYEYFYITVQKSAICCALHSFRLVVYFTTLSW